MFLIILALLPAVLIMRYIYNKDRIEKEPAGLLWRIACFGAGTVVSAFILEYVGMAVLGYIFPKNGLIYRLLMYFLVVSLCEEGGKFLVTMHCAWNHPAFNYRYDAIVYCVCASLGFAALENINYVLSGGLQTAVARAVFSVPLHAFCGVYMGLYMGQAKACDCVGNLKGSRKNHVLSLLVPVLIHGFYDFCLSASSTVATLIFLAFVAGSYAISIMVISRSAREDSILSANWDTPFSEQYKEQR